MRLEGLNFVQQTLLRSSKGLSWLANHADNDKNRQAFTLTANTLAIMAQGTDTKQIDICSTCGQAQVVSR